MARFQKHRRRGLVASNPIIFAGGSTCSETTKQWGDTRRQQPTAGPHKTTIFNLEDVIKELTVTDSNLNKDTNELQKVIGGNEDKYILVVEDHEEMRAYLKLVLKDYKVILATNGKEGLKALKNYNFSAIITDYMMPVMDGVTFVKELKKNDIIIPTIVLTARRDDLGKLNMLRLGIDGYITKPFIEEELLVQINRAITLYDKIKDYEVKVPIDEKLELIIDKGDFNKDIQNHILDNIKNKNFGVDDLASLLFLSRSSLFRKTKLILGQTPNEVIKEVKLKKAKEILEDNPKIKRKDLAESVGVHNAAYLIKKLEERYHVV